MLPFGSLEEEFLRSHRHAFWAESPYVALVEDEYDEIAFVPILGFTLGAPRIVVPNRIKLTAEALRALAVGRVIMGPVSVDLEEY